TVIRLKRDGVFRDPDLDSSLGRAGSALARREPKKAEHSAADASRKGLVGVIHSVRTCCEGKISLERRFAPLIRNNQARVTNEP
ncbi:MAG: hypothetical protein M3P24_00145, partial [Gemmatimonadota bacterium]|nr:hypothetical protein [Gemmatimonadota bacterium]